MHSWLEKVPGQQDSLPLEPNPRHSVSLQSVGADSVADSVIDMPSTLYQTRDKQHIDSDNDSDRDGTIMGPEEASRSDVEDENDLEMVKSAIQSGHEEFEKNNYSDAALLHKEAHVLLDRLSIRQRAQCDEAMLMYELAACSFQQEGPSAAIPALLGVLKLRASTSIQKKHLYLTHYLLAKAYVERGELDLAKKFCQRAAGGRQKVFGKLDVDEGRFDCLALMALIHQRQGQSAIARLFWKRLPPSQQRLFLKADTGYAVFSRPAPNEQQPSLAAKTLIGGQFRLDVSTRTWWLTALGQPLVISSIQEALVSANISRAIELIENGELEHGSPISQGVELFQGIFRIYWSALHYAALFGDLDVVEALIRRGEHSDSNRFCRIANRDFFMADFKESPEYDDRVPPLVEVGFMQPIHLAAGAGHMNLVKVLARHMEVSVLCHDDAIDLYSGIETAALHCGSLAAVLLNPNWMRLRGANSPQKLIEDIKVIESLGWDIEKPIITPEFGGAATIDDFVEYAHNRVLRNMSQDKSPTFWNDVLGHFFENTNLWDREDRRKSPFCYGETALDLAVREFKRPFEILELLIKCGPQGWITRPHSTANDIRPNGCRALWLLLHWIKPRPEGYELHSVKKAVEMMEQLFKFGARTCVFPQQKSECGNLLETACSAIYPSSIIELLLKRDPNAEVWTRHGPKKQTALHSLAEAQFLCNTSNPLERSRMVIRAQDIAKILVEAGADRRSENKDGHNAWGCYVRRRDRPGDIDDLRFEEKIIPEHDLSEEDLYD